MGAEDAGTAATRASIPVRTVAGAAAVASTTPASKREEGVVAAASVAMAAVGRRRGNSKGVAAAVEAEWEVAAGTGAL